MEMVRLTPGPVVRKPPKDEVAGGRTPAEQRVYEVLDLGNSESGGLEMRAQLKRFGTIVA